MNRVTNEEERKQPRFAQSLKKNFLTRGSRKLEKLGRVYPLRPSPFAVASSDEEANEGYWRALLEKLINRLQE